MTTGAEDDISLRQLVEALLKAINNADVEAILSLHTPDAVFYEVQDALRYGPEGLKKAWEEYFNMMRSFNIGFHDSTMMISDKLAFSYWLAHVEGIKNNGETLDLWLRHTTCYKKIKNKWFIVHSHVSIPADFLNGILMINLKP